MKFHLERSGFGPEYTLEIWGDGPPMKSLAIIPTHAFGREETERLAKLMLDAVNVGIVCDGCQGVTYLSSANEVNANDRPRT